MNKNRQMQRQAGFTLIEIMVVVVILGLLAGVGAVAVMRNRADANNGIAKSKCASLQKDIINFILADSARVDLSPEDIWEAMAEGGYLKRGDIKDPWSEDYLVSRDERDNYIVHSKGADRQDNTDDDVYEGGLMKDGGASQDW